jgi:hypothetical protein
MGNTMSGATDPGLLADKSANPERDLQLPDCWVRARDRFITEYAPLPPEPPPAESGVPDEDEWAQRFVATVHASRFADLERITAIQDDMAPGGWLPLVRPGQFVHPRSETAHILQVVDRRKGTSDSLTLIRYGPVEFALRKVLAQLNWRRWWR